MKPPPWQTVRISHLDLTLAWSVCLEARLNGKGAISRTAASCNLPVSIVQKALDRMEKAMGGGPLFVEGVKRTGRLTDRGLRFLEQSDKLIEAWTATLEVDLHDNGPPPLRSPDRG